MPAIDHITIARQMVTGGTASAKLRDELADYDRMSRIIESAAAEGRTVGRNVHYWRDAANANVRQMVEAMTPAEPEPVVAASNAELVIRRRLRDLEFDRASARRDSQDWLLVNAQIGVLQSVAHELSLGG